MHRHVRVLLLWPGTDGAAAGNFGVPQLVTMGTYIREKTGARVVIRDLQTEKFFGPVVLPKLLAGEDGHGYDIIALGCYSSFDYLKCVAIAQAARSLHPGAVIVAGGYHASARPGDIVFDGSPFDVCIIGEGERPMVRVVESVSGGSPLRNEILDSDPIDVLDDLPPSDWSLLDRYRTIARRTASQTQLYLSRGCPFDCAFCMERAKREVSWRAYSVERAVEEVRRLNAFIPLKDWTVYIADALFGMKTSWRKQFLEALIREGIDVKKFWLLIRVDLVDDKDLSLFAKANCGLGFGLESGDPTLLAAIRKAGRLDDYLERMNHVAAHARELNVPWGANIIVGHPGETPATLERSAKYMHDLFLDPKGTTGFLSVDAFRLYPGSPIDAERGAYEQKYGCRFHRPDWWHDGDQEFLAEWVDPSRDLDYLTRMEMQQRLLAPVLARIKDNYVYRGASREYFVGAIDDQVAQTRPEYQLHFLDRYYAWQRYLGRSRAGFVRRTQDVHLAQTARTLRERRLEEIARIAELDTKTEAIDARILEVIAQTPRECFVPLDAIKASVLDEPVALDNSGAATVSAMHAYACSFKLLGVTSGDVVLDLGAGTGYGTALIAQIVGPTGSVVGIEVDPALAARGAFNVQPFTHAQVIAGDATEPHSWSSLGIDPTWLRSVNKVTVGFALTRFPEAFAQVFAPGTVMVAPVGAGRVQHLTRATVTPARTLEMEQHATVVYVRERHEEDLPAPPIESVARKRASVVHLPVVD